jgi:hypothetical protein
MVQLEIFEGPQYRRPTSQSSVVGFHQSTAATRDGSADVLPPIEYAKPLGANLRCLLKEIRNAALEVKHVGA